MSGPVRSSPVQSSPVRSGLVRSGLLWSGNLLMDFAAQSFLFSRPHRIGDHISLPQGSGGSPK
jgi:hypothetical protein